MTSEEPKKPAICARRVITSRLQNMQTSRTPATEAAAEHAHRVQQLQSVADSLEQRNGAATMPLQLDLLPALLQYLLSSGTKIEEHVAYQSLERLCLGAVGQQHLMPAERYANLQSFERAQQVMFGRACTHFMHGQGWKANRIQRTVTKKAAGERPKQQPHIWWRSREVY